MKFISNEGLNLIKRFEGCRLTAYKPVASEKYYTIGWGHYGPDVRPGQTITQKQADNLLRQDIGQYEGYVNLLDMTFTQNQFDALVSFCYNCGPGNLHTLTKNRTHAQIADALLNYNKGGGVVLNGLVKRRVAERELFLKPDKETNCEGSEGLYKVTASALNVRSGLGTNYRIIRVLKKNDVVEVNTICHGWGQLDEGWINLKYTKKL